MRAHLSRIGLLLVLVMMVAACGGAEDDATDDTDAAESDDAEGSGDADEEAAADGEGELDAPTVRIMADFPPPPFNAAVAIDEMGLELEERLPGSEFQSYYAGSLYPSESEALEAMVPGNLEMIFGQYGKAGGFEPWMNIVTQPYNFTTIGAQRQFPETETAQMLEERMAERGIEILGNAHLSFLLAVGSQERITDPEQLAGHQIRSMDPLVGNEVLSQWEANPTTMAFGEVPSALETGALDSLVTSVGGWLTVQEQAPYYNVLGVGGVTTDLYYVGVSSAWWDELSPATQEVIQEWVDEVTQLSDELTYCDDQKAVQDFGTEDPDEEGIYFLEDDEIASFRDELGTAPSDLLKEELDEDAHEWIDRIAEEGQELSEEHPEGSDPLEETDCEAIWEEYDR